MLKNLLIAGVLAILCNFAYGLSIQDMLQRFEGIGNYRFIGTSQGGDTLIFVDSNSIKSSAYACDTSHKYKQVWTYGLIQSKKELISMLYVINCSKDEYAVPAIRIWNNYGDSIKDYVSYPGNCLPQGEFNSIDPMSLMYSEEKYVCSHK